MTEAPFTFKPHGEAGRLWKDHASRCSRCCQNAKVSGAGCVEGKALRDAYVQSLGKQRGERNWTAEMLRAWGPVLPTPPARTIDQQPRAPSRVMHLFSHPLGEHTKEVVTVCGVTTREYRTTSNRRDVRCPDCEVAW